RADDGARPLQQERSLGDDRRARRRRNDSRVDDAVPRGGRSTRVACGRRRPGPRDRRRFTRAAQGAARKHGDRDRARRWGGRGARARRRRASRHALARARGLDCATDDTRRCASSRRRAARSRRRGNRSRDAHGSRAESRRRVPRVDRTSRGGGGGMSAGQLATTAPGGHRRFMPAVVSDTLAIAWRGVITYRRVPQLLVFSTIQPVVFVVLFRYVFGGAIHVPGVDYVDYLMPGIFVQTTVFGAIATAIGLATDVQTGLLERFRSLPMARSAVLTGRTIADLFRNVFVVILMAGVGFLVGWTVHTNAAKFVLAMLLVLLFGYSMSWVFATVGLAIGNPEAAQAASFP